MAVGDSYSAVQQAVLEEAAQRHGALEAAMNRLLATAGQIRQQQNVNAQMAQQKLAFAAQQRQLALENAFREQQAAIQNRRLDIQQDIGKGYLDLGNRQLDTQAAQGTAAGNREKDFQFNNMLNDANSGLYDNAEHVLQMNKGIQPETAQMMAQRSMQKRQEITDAYNASAGAAATLNQYNQLAAAKKEADAAAGWATPSGRAATEKSKLLANQMALMQKRVDAINHVMNTNPNFVVSNPDPNDPTKLIYQPPVSQPKWLQQGYQPFGRDLSNAMPGSDDADTDQGTETQPSTVAPSATDAQSLGPSAVATPAPAPDRSLAAALPTTAPSPFQVQAAPQEPIYHVQSPDGSSYAIPQSKLATAKARGATIMGLMPGGQTSMQPYGGVAMP